MKDELEINEIKRLIDELEFFELLDLIEILIMKSQFLEKSKGRCFLFCQKYTLIQTFRLNSIQEEIDAIQLKIELLIQNLRKSCPIDIE